MVSRLTVRAGYFGARDLSYKATNTLLHPALQCFVDGLTAGLEIVRNALFGPAFAVQSDHGQAALGGRRDGVVGRDAARGAGWRWRFFEDTFDGGGVRAASKADVTDSRQFMHTQGRMFRLEVEDMLADVVGERIRLRR
jgi:hypothetical protein